MSFAAVGAAAAVGSLAYGLSQGGGDAPSSPNYAAATKEGVVTDASLLPYKKIVDAAAKMGKKVTVKDPVTGEMTELDFSGLGDADTAAEYADKMAQAALKLQQTYGAQFIEEANKQLALANPQETAAKTKLFDEIMADQNRVEDRTLAKTLQQQMIDELNAGGSTDAETNREIEQFLTAQQSARGGGYGTADEYERAMGVGQAAEARKAQKKQQAMAWLTSGATPEDADFRTRQQNKANLGSFISGTKPSAEFASLSGAQNGAAPFISGAPGPTLNPNAGQQGAQYAQNTYNTQMGYAAGQANDWMGAIGLGLQAYGTFNTGGGAFKNPWGTKTIQGGWGSSIPQGQV